MHDRANPPEAIDRLPMGFRLLGVAGLTISVVIVLLAFTKGFVLPALALPMVGGFCLLGAVAGLRRLADPALRALPGARGWAIFDLVGLGLMGLGILAAWLTDGTRLAWGLAFMGLGLGGLSAFRRIGLRLRGDHARADA